MIQIKNKRDSVKKIKELKLNNFPEDVFSTSDLVSIEKFFKKYSAEEYCMRTTSKAKGQFFFVKDFQECKALLSKFKDEVTICVSYNPYKEDIVLVGDIKVSRMSSGDIVDIVARTDPEATQRNIYDDPEYNYHASLDDDKVWKIPGFSKIMNYIVEHELYDMIIEFIVYDIKVGINKENVVIVEIRTDY